MFLLKFPEGSSFPGTVVCNLTMACIIENFLPKVGPKESDIGFIIIVMKDYYFTERRNMILLDYRI